MEASGRLTQDDAHSWPEENLWSKEILFFFHQLSPKTLIYHYELHQNAPYCTICGLSASSCADETQTLDEQRSSGRVFFFLKCQTFPLLWCQVVLFSLLNALYVRDYKNELSLPSRHPHVFTQLFYKFCKASCSVWGWHEWNFPTFCLRTFRLKIMGCLVVGGILLPLWAFAVHIRNWCGSLSAHCLLETPPSCNGSVEWHGL